MTETELKIELYERTRDIEYSEGLCQAIEDDYLINSAYYSDDQFFKYMEIMESMIRENWRANNLSDNEKSPSELLKLFKEIFNQSQT